MKLTYTITGEAETQQRFLSVADRIREELALQMETTMENLQDYIKQSKLSGQSVNVRSGRLRAAVSHRVLLEGKDIRGEVFIPLAQVPYAGVLNDGGRTRPHTILPRSRYSLRFIAGDGATVFARRVNHPGSQFSARNFMGGGLTDMTQRILKDLQEAAVRGLKK
jgi:hypothetical protein